MTDLDTGAKTRMLFIDKNFKVDKTGSDDVYYVTHIEKFSQLYIIYLSYEGKPLVVLSEMDKKQLFKSKKSKKITFINLI